MSGRSENAPLLGDNDYSENGDAQESHVSRTIPANTHFKLPIRILTSAISFLSISVAGLLIAVYVLIQTGSFGYTYSSRNAARELAICVGSFFSLTSSN